MSQKDEVRRMLADGKVVRRRDLTSSGVARSTIEAMIRAGDLEEVGDRVGFRLTGIEAPRPSSENLVAAALKIGAKGVLCFWSALRLHGLTDETASNAPDCVAIRPGVSPNPRSGLEAKLIRWGDPRMFELGVEAFEVAPGLWMPVTNPARTVLDCFAPIRSDISLAAATDALAWLTSKDPGAASEVLELAVCFGPAWQARAEAAVLAAQATKERASWSR